MTGLMPCSPSRAARSDGQRPADVCSPRRPSPGCIQAEKLAMELNQAREELSRRVAQAAEGADAMLQNAAGAINMLNVS